MKLAKASVIYRAVQDLASLGAIILFSGGFAVQSLNPIMLLAVAVAAFGVIAAVFTWEYLVWKNYDYFIHEKNVEIKHGVLRKSHREMPLRRIQNVDITRNFVHRILGIAKVNLETAGGKTTEASLKFVEEDKARDIQRKIKQLKRGQEDKADRVEEQELLFELEQRDMFILGFTSFNLQLVLMMFFGLSIAGGFIGSVLESSGLSLVLGLSALALVGLIFTWLSGALSAVLKYYGFKLWRSKGSLEYERGLFNRSEGSIPFEKIQSLTIEENPLKRLIGYSTLKIETAGYGSQNETGSGAEAAIPLAEHDRTVEFANMIEDFGELELHSIPKRARRRYFGRYMIVVGLIAAGSLLVDYWISFMIVLALTPVAAMAAHLKWKNIGYGMGKGHFYSMQGFWNRETTIMPYYRIQNLIETRTIFQRRWGLTTLTLDIAGANIFQKDAVAMDIDREAARKLREDVYSKFKDSLLKKK